MLNKIDVGIEFKKQEYLESELNLVNDIFGIFTKNVYFKIDVNHELNNDKFVNFFGISGSGKTVIKDLIKEQLLNENKNVLDFDDLENFYDLYKDKTILELFEITSSKDPILKLLSGFGLFEIRLLTTKIKDLSTGQRTRLKYVYLVKLAEQAEFSYILIDEFLTFVDSLSSVSFARSLRKYLEDKPVQLFTFGVNDSLVNNFENITLILGNTKINAVVKDGEFIDLCKNEPKE